MINKENFTQHISDLDTKDLINKTLDKIEIVLKNHEIKYTDFLNPFEQQSIVNVLKSFSDLRFSLFGGYLNAERKIIAIYYDYLEESSIENPIGALEIRVRSDNKLNHRDVLGAALGLGIRREKIGDILIHTDCFQIVLQKALKDFMLFNLNKIGRFDVELKGIELNELKPMKVEYKSITGFLASLRLDALVGMAFNISRGDAQGLISKERVTVNWETVQRNDYIFKAGDVITARGKGRAIVEVIGGRTKSDRIKVVVKKPI